MRAALMLVTLLGCAPALTSKPVPRTASEVLGPATTDLGKMTALLHGAVVNGGLYFEDAACANQFTVGETEPALRDQFARCLVGLSLKPSARKDQLTRSWRYAPVVVNGAVAAVCTRVSFAFVSDRPTRIQRQ